MRAAFTVLVGTVLALMGCAGPRIQHHQLSRLDKGISPHAVESRLQLPPCSVHTSTVGGRVFEFHRFQIDNGFQTDRYLLAYEKSLLVYWGYVSEFRRLNDAELNAALEKVLPEILSTK